MPRLLLGSCVLALFLCGCPPKEPTASDSGGGGDTAGDSADDTAQDSAEDSGEAECFGGNESLFEDCMIVECCDVLMGCGVDTDCYQGFSCLLRCVGTFAECEPECAVSGNAAWDAFAACGLSECADQTCTYGSSPAR